jgi:CubicO group peptidase (beta-lactamase class C family)
MRSLALSILTLLVAACGAKNSATTATVHAGGKLVDPARIDKVLRGYVERGDVVGVSALVYEDGKQAYFGAFGQADREAGRPMRRDTLVQIFSMTKPITGVTLMTLYEQGLFDLDDPLANYLPEFEDVRVYDGGQGDDVRLRAPSRPPTIRDILRHTAGFGSDDDRYTNWAAQRFRAVDPGNRENTLAELTKKLASVPLFYDPGTHWIYGISVDVQARLVEVLSGKRFETMMRERVLDPLKMTDTQYVLRPDQRERISALYTRNPDGSFTRQPDDEALAFNLQDWPLKPGSSGLTSTLDDYMRFARMLLNGGELDGVRILEPETIRLMATDAMPATVVDRSWLPNKGQVGFGIDFAVRVAPPASQAEASGTVGEFFWDGAANTLFWVDAKNELAAVLFLFYRPFGKIEIQKDFRDAVYYRDPVASALNKPPAGPGARRLSD